MTTHRTETSPKARLHLPCVPLAEGYATLEARKLVEPKRWHTAVHESAHGVIAMVLGFHVPIIKIAKHGTTIEGIGGATWVRYYRQPTSREKILGAIYTIAAYEAELRIGTFNEKEFKQSSDYKKLAKDLAAYCSDQKVELDTVIGQLRNYVRIVVNQFWRSIIAVAERLMIRGVLKSGEIGRIHWAAINKQNVEVSPHPFSGPLAAVLDGN